MTLLERPSQFVQARPAEPELLAYHYDELRRMARRIICDDAQRHVLQPTELVNESVLRLIRSGLDAVGDREHLLALAARTMRRVLIDEARRAHAAKRRPLLTFLPGAAATGLTWKCWMTPSRRSHAIRPSTAGWSSCGSAWG